MKKYVLLFLIINSCNAFSQTIWKKNFLGSQSEIFNLFESSDGRYFVGQGNGYLILDSMGNKIGQKNMSHFLFNRNSDLLYNSSINKINDTLFFINIAAQHTCSISLDSLFAPAIIIVDSSGNIIAEKKYILNGYCNTIPRNISRNADAGFILSGVSASPFVSDPPQFANIICTDSALNVKWAKYFTNYYGGTQFAKQAPDGSFIIGLNLDTVGAVVARTDSLGNFLWCKSYFRPKGFIHAITMNDDGTFVVVGYTDSVNVGLFGSYPPGFDIDMFMMKLDTSGAVLWCKSFDTPHYGGWVINSADIKSTPDGGYILTGPGEMPSGNAVVLIKTGANGDTLWTSWHGNPPAYLHYKEKVFMANDGGYLVGGMCYGNFPGGQQGGMFLFKLDSTGHGISCTERYDTIVTGTLIVNDSDFVLASIDGAVAVPANILDTIYPPFTQWDHCSILGIHDLPGSLNQKVFSYPNPNNGKVYLKTSSSRKKNIRVFNSIGAIVFEIKKTTDRDIEIDLSSQPSGIYLIRIDDGEQVKTQRVVVQQ